ncbi:D-2-hydroxyacid dehydrogenase [soil metagenome]
MKTIVVLDAHTLSPLQPGEHSASHPSWDKLSSFGHLTLHPRTKPEDIVARAAGAEILLTNKAKVTAEHIAALPNLQYIGVMATGYNIVDLAAARERGIPVTNVPGYSTMSVAQCVFALLLEVAVKVGANDAAVKNGDWVRCPDFYFSVAPISELAGKTLGIIGLGTIGQAVARIGAAFGMRIVTYSRSRKDFDTPVEWLSLDEVFAQSDVLTLHCPLTPETDHFINRENLAKMKPSAILINTSRGPLINEADLATALKNKALAGFGADVLSEEPPPAHNPLLSAPNTVITPHIAWASVEARCRLMDILADNLTAFLAGTPINVVNGAPATPPAPAPAPAEAALPEPATEAPIAPDPSPAPEPPQVSSRFWNFRPAPRRRLGLKSSARFKRVRQAATPEPLPRRSRRTRARKKQS